MIHTCILKHWNLARRNKKSIFYTNNQYSGARRMWPSDILIKNISSAIFHVNSDKNETTTSCVSISFSTFWLSECSPDIFLSFALKTILFCWNFCKYLFYETLEVRSNSVIVDCSRTNCYESLCVNIFAFEINSFFCTAALLQTLLGIFLEFPSFNWFHTERNRYFSPI